MEHREFRT